MILDLAFSVWGSGWLGCLVCWPVVSGPTRSVLKPVAPCLSSWLVAACRLSAAMRMWAHEFMEHLPIGQQICMALWTNAFWQRWSLDNVTLPSGLQSITFGFRLDQSPDAVTLPSDLQGIPFGFCFVQGLGAVSLPSGLQSVTFGSRLVQGLDAVTLPRGLQSIAFGDDLISVSQSDETLDAYSNLRLLEACGITLAQIRDAVVKFCELPFFHLVGELWTYDSRSGAFMWQNSRLDA